MQFVNKLLKGTVCDNTTIIPTEYRENGWGNNILLNSEGLTAPLCYFNGHIYSISNFKLRWYNRDTDKFDTIITTPEELHYSIISYKNKVYGFSYSEGKSFIYEIIYDDNGTPSYVTKCAELPYFFFRGCVCVYDDEIHFFGSSKNGDDTSNMQKHYSWNGSSFTLLGSIPCYGSCGVSIYKDNIVHIFEGDEGITSAPSSKHYILKNSVWTICNNRPFSGYAHNSIVLYDNKIHIVGNGGIVGDSENLLKHYEYDDVNDNYIRLQDVPNNGQSVLGYSICASNIAIHIYTCIAPSTYNHYIYGRGVGDTKYIFSKNTNIFSESSIVELPDNSKIIDPNYKYFIYNDELNHLLYTNSNIVYNSNTSKYEIYGYFLTSLKNTTVPIIQDGWQTLELDEPRLFK